MEFNGEADQFHALVSLPPNLDLSRFVNNLTVAMPGPGRRYALFNAEFAVHHVDGPSERRRLAGAREIRGVLEEVFGLAVPADPELDAALERLK